ncbi:hypothetical protein NDU88_002808 [Pleurodeles waltl]|uniref:Uncharacterized protein n=1 Tax=Pleurodeles waltl TaxID=8319 RepID=A0AAV7REV0_PLEWA|nr:hypothetical protein NDU88_002808 [Pleurodeles waltl]
MPNGNPDIQVSEDMKSVGGQRTRCVVVEEEEKDAGEEEESVTKNAEDMEGRENARKSVLTTEEEEPIKTRPLDPGDNIREGDSERQQLHHVPGGAWVQQVRSA